MIDRTENSRELYSRAVELMPGGVSSPVRAFGSVGGTPIYFRDASGARFTDEDGNEYVDYCMSWGPLILGHAHPKVVAAVREAAGRGLSYGACCRAEVDLAEAMLDRLPGCDMIRFVSSGTEAVMTAIRIARGVTGRDLVLKFDGGYHGHGDTLLVKAGSGLATLGTSSSSGVPASVAKATIVCPFDDEPALEAVFDRFGPKLAAAVVEPIPANNGLLEQRPEWMRALRRLTSRHGAMLIMDEVITGFRLRRGAWSTALDIPADLSTFGKVIGGGMPVGAIAGPRSTMEGLAPVGPVYQAGTLSGNPVSLAAGLATLDALDLECSYEALENLGSILDSALTPLAARHEHFSWRRAGSIFWLHLAGKEIPRRADAIDPGASERYKVLHAHLLSRGVYLAPSAYEVGFLSTAHTIEDISRFAEALEEGLSLT